MSGIATAIVVSAVIGGAVAKKGADKAASAQEHATDVANSELGREYDLTREDYRPYREAGVSVLPQLTEGLKPGGDFNRDFTIADFYKDPGYDFRMQQGSDALEHSAAARGGLNSGATGKALLRFGQDYGSNEFSNAYTRFNNDRTTRFNRLSALAGTGQTATNATTQAGNQTVAQMAENTLQGGNARAAGYVGGANAVGGAIGGTGQTLADFYLQRQYLNKIPPLKPAPTGGQSPYVGYGG